MINKKQGLTLLEVLMTAAILSLLLGIGAHSLWQANQVWNALHTRMDLEEQNLRALDRLRQELQFSAADHVEIIEQATVQGVDLIRFQLPVLCSSGEGAIPRDHPAQILWSAPLPSACRGRECLPLTEACGQQDSYYLEYGVNQKQEFFRRVIDSQFRLLREDPLAANIHSFQVSLPASGLAVVQLTAQKRFGQQELTAQSRAEIFLRNSQLSPRKKNL